VTYDTIDVVTASIQATENDFSIVPGDVNQQILTTFTSTNPSAVASDFTAAINWDDGSSSVGTIVANGDGTFSVDGAHSYAAAGSESVTISITGAASETTTVTDAVTVSTLWVSTNSIAIDQDGYFTGIVGHFDSSISSDPSAYTCGS